MQTIENGLAIGARNRSWLVNTINCCAFPFLRVAFHSSHLNLSSFDNKIKYTISHVRTCLPGLKEANVYDW